MHLDERFYTLTIGEELNMYRYQYRKLENENDALRHGALNPE